MIYQKIVSVNKSIWSCLKEQRVPKIVIYMWNYWFSVHFCDFCRVSCCDNICFRFSHNFYVFLQQLLLGNVIIFYCLEGQKRSYNVKEKKIKLLLIVLFRDNKTWLLNRFVGRLYEKKVKVPWYCGTMRYQNTAEVCCNKSKLEQITRVIISN